MPYVDAMFDRDQDIIRVVERRDGKRHFTEYPAKYTFYYEDPKGKYKSVYGDPLTRIVCKNTKDFRKEVAINKGKNLFESDINPIFQCLSENYLNQDAPKLNIAFLILRLTLIQSVALLIQAILLCQLHLYLYTYSGWRQWCVLLFLLKHLLWNRHKKNLKALIM